MAEQALRSRSTTAAEGSSSDQSADPLPSHQHKPLRQDGERFPAFLAPAIALGFVAIILYFAAEPSISPKIWTSEELSKYNGTDQKMPILLGILGSVFDVTKGKTHYGVNGSYHHFAGRDASRAFASGNFSGDGLTDSVAGLSNFEIKSLVDWRSFYKKSYIYVGKLVGTYHDANGKETKELRKVEAKAKLGERLVKKQEAEEKKYPVCNSRWSQQLGGEVWCDSGYPRLVDKVGEMPQNGGKEKRCACFTTEQLGKAGLQVYEGCDPLQSTCKVS